MIFKWIAVTLIVLVNTQQPSDDTKMVQSLPRTPTPLPFLQPKATPSGAKTQGKYNLVYVDSKKGTNLLSCGSALSSPCRSLDLGLKRVKTSGIVYIVGKQTLDSGLDLYKDVTITSMGDTPEYIFGCKTSRIPTRQRGKRSNKKKQVKRGKKWSSKGGREKGTGRRKQKGNDKRKVEGKGQGAGQGKGIGGKSSKKAVKNLKGKKGIIKKTKGDGLEKDCRFAFIVKKANITLQLSNVHFSGISLVKMRPDSDVRLTNVNVTDCNTSLISIPLQLKNNFNLSIRNSSFFNTGQVVVIPGSIRNLYFKDGYGDRSKISIADSLFNNTRGFQFTYVKRIRVQNSTFVNHFRGKEAIFVLQKCGEFNLAHSYYQSSKTKSEKGGFIRALASQSVAIKRCSFYRGVSEGLGGAFYFERIETATIIDSLFRKCLSSFGGGAVALYNIGTKAEFRRCQFDDNKSKFGGGIFANVQLFYRRMEFRRKSGKVRIKFQVIDSFFVDNQARGIGQAVYSNEKSLFQNISIKGKKMYHTTHFHNEGEKVNIENVRIEIREGKIQSGIVSSVLRTTSPDIKLDGRVEIICPKHLNIRVEHMTNYGPRNNRFKRENIRTLFMARCESCPANQYTLIKGRYQIVKAGQTKKRKYKKIMYEKNITKSNCLSCPSGALCDGDIKPIENYWGHLISNAEVRFIKCPAGFCCSSQTTPCKSFNTCAKGRTGKLCSFCANGYSQSFVSDGCVLKSGIQCNIHTFIAYFILASLIYTLLFTFTPSFIAIIKDLFVSVKNKSRDDGEQEQISLHEVEKNAQACDDSKIIIPLPMSAVITMIFLFFQISSLVHVRFNPRKDVPNETSQTQSSPLKRVFDFFNFRFSINQELCPMDDLTLPTKEFMNIGLKLCSILYLLLIFFGWRLFNLIKSCLASPIGSDSRKREDHTIEERIQPRFEHEKLNFPSILKIGFIKLVKLNFTSLSTFAFHMVHCVSIGNISYLYLYAGYQCYTLWQQVILFVVLPIVVLFPLSFGMGLNLLKDGFVSTTGFLIASVIPVYSIILYMKKRVSGLNRQQREIDDEKCAKQILEMEEELFREDPAAWLRWPVVQLYRNLLVVIMDTFILNSIYKSIAFIPVFAMFVIHDRHRRPYKHPYLNCLQVLSSYCLVVVNGCNIPASFNSMTNLLGIPLMGTVLSAMKQIELGMFVIMPSSLILWKIWEKYDIFKQQKKETRENCKAE